MHYRDHVNEIETAKQEGLEEGRAEGREECREVGKNQELCEDIQEILRERFGDCPHLIAERLETLHDSEQLRALLRLAVQWQTLEEFKQALA